MTPIQRTRKIIDWYDRTRHVMDHFINGGSVETTALTGKWTPIKDPVWGTDCEYRIAPRRPRIGLAPKLGLEDYLAIELTPEVRAVLKEAGIIDEE